MIGFSFKNLVLQIIHGAVIIAAVAMVYHENNIEQVSGFCNEKETVILAIFLLASFAVGVLVDFIADNLESLFLHKLIKPPVYYLLTKKRFWAIALAHHSEIMERLCMKADKYKGGEIVYNEGKDHKEWQNRHINYLLQVAKNQAFRDCKDYQREQIDSFFVLYIFARNLAFSLIVAMAVTALPHWKIAVCLLVGAVLSLIASYRYYLYYLRILLGSTFDPK